MSERVDPSFPRYHIGATTFDGPRKTDGEIVVQFWCRAVVVPVDEKLAAGEPIQLQVFDFVGPRVERDPGPIPEELLDACALRLREKWDLTPVGENAPTARDIAQVVLEEIGQRLHPSDSEAASLAIGVRRLDVEKLTKTGDEMAEFIREFAPDEPSLRRESIAEVLATWKGQAHRDWSDLHALRRSTR
jgi:hypothetical protein